MLFRLLKLCILISTSNSQFLENLCLFSDLAIIHQAMYSSNNVVWCMAKLFSVSDEFDLLCTKVGITPHRIDVIRVYALRCSVYNNKLCDNLITVTAWCMYPSVVYIVSLCLSLYHFGEYMCSLIIIIIIIMWSPSRILWSPNEMSLQPFTLFSFNISAWGFVLVGPKNNNNNDDDDDS